MKTILFRYLIADLLANINAVDDILNVMECRHHLVHSLYLAYLLGKPIIDKFADKRLKLVTVRRLLWEQPLKFFLQFKVAAELYLHLRDVELCADIEACVISLQEVKIVNPLEKSLQLVLNIYLRLLAGKVEVPFTGT